MLILLEIKLQILNEEMRWWKMSCVAHYGEWTKENIWWSLYSYYVYNRTHDLEILLQCVLVSVDHSIHCKAISLPVRLLYRYETQNCARKVSHRNLTIRQDKWVVSKLLQLETPLMWIGESEVPHHKNTLKYVESYIPTNALLYTIIY